MTGNPLSEASIHVERQRADALHPAWRAFIRHCELLRHGEIERLKIQDGLPVLAEVSRTKVRFTE
jgi:hypothetical protein